MFGPSSGWSTFSRPSDTVLPTVSAGCSQRRVRDPQRAAHPSSAVFPLRATSPHDLRMKPVEVAHDGRWRPATVERWMRGTRRGCVGDVRWCEDVGAAARRTITADRQRSVVQGALRRSQDGDGARHWSLRTVRYRGSDARSTPAPIRGSQQVGPSPRTSSDVYGIRTGPDRRFRQRRTRADASVYRALVHHDLVEGRPARGAGPTVAVRAAGNRPKRREHRPRSFTRTARPTTRRLDERTRPVTGDDRRARSSCSANASPPSPAWYPPKGRAAPGRMSSARATRADRPRGFLTRSRRVSTTPGASGETPRAAAGGGSPKRTGGVRARN